MHLHLPDLIGCKIEVVNELNDGMIGEKYFFIFFPFFQKKGNG
jgi:hypothetical protein